MNAVAYLAFAHVCLLLGLTICYLTFVIQCFLHGEAEMGAVWLVTCCCVIGALGAFFYGWSKADEWDNVPLMATWSLFMVLALISEVIIYSATQSLAPL